MKFKKLKISESEILMLPLLVVANGMFFLGTERYNDNWVNWTTAIGFMFFYDLMVVLVLGGRLKLRKPQ